MCQASKILYELWALCNNNNNNNNMNIYMFSSRTVESLWHRRSFFIVFIKAAAAFYKLWLRNDKLRCGKLNDMYVIVVVVAAIDFLLGSRYCRCFRARNFSKISLFIIA